MLHKVTAVVERTKNVLAPLQLQHLADGIEAGRRCFLPLADEAKVNEFLGRLMKDFTNKEFDEDRVSADPSFIIALQIMLKKASETFITDCVDPK